MRILFRQLLETVGQFSYFNIWSHWTSTSGADAFAVVAAAAVSAHQLCIVFLFKLEKSSEKILFRDAHNKAIFADRCGAADRSPSYSRCYER